jgi:aspartyl-tRNA(Asn)/glutamyl-tRNA(Gln) amidotransferase subunit A
MCGVVGLKPTYGRVSRYGCFPEAWTLDHVGPIAASVADAALMLDALSGWDGHDAASLRRPPTRTFPRLRSDLTGTVIGVEEDFFFADVDNDIASLVFAAVERLKDFGAVIRPVYIPDLRDADYALSVIDTSETTTVHQENLRSRPEDYSPVARFVLECGAFPSAVDYLTAQQVRERIRLQFREVFDAVDVLVAPTLPMRVPTIGAELATINGVEVDLPAARSRLLAPASLVGLPTLSVPCGLLDGMPVGLQVLGRPLGEQDVLNIGLAIEQLVAGSAG